MATRRQLKMAYLANSGLLAFEQRAFADAYEYKSLRTLPYIQNLLRARRLYIANQRNAGMTNPQIIDRIKSQYVRNQWVDKDNHLDVWHMLRKYRKDIIDSGGNPSPGYAPKRSHKSVRQQITSAQLSEQKRRRGTKRRELQDRIDDLNLLASRAATEQDRRTYLARRDLLANQLKGLK